MRYILSILSLALCLSLQSQTCFSQIGTADIRSITEDIQYIYMGTDEGFVRYDKASEILSIWSIENSDLAEDLVRSVLRYQEDVYLCTDSSLYRFDLSTEQIIMVNDTLSGQLAIGAQNQLIVAGDLDYYELESEFVVYHQDLGEVLSLSCPGICDKTTDVEVMDNGEVWISHFGFYEFDLLSFDGEEWTNYDIQSDPEVFPSESWSANKLDSKENSILSTSWGGLVQFDGNNWAVLDNGNPPQVIEGPDTLRLGHTGVAFDQNAGYWFGTSHDYMNNAPAKLAYFDAFSWHIYSLPLDSAHAVVDLAVSSFNSDHLFIATTGGLLILDKNCIGLPDGLSGLEIAPIKLYPVPATDVLRFSKSITSELSIINGIGETVYSEKLIDQERVILPRLSSGIYIVRFNIDGSQIGLPITID